MSEDKDMFIFLFMFCFCVLSDQRLNALWLEKCGKNFQMEMVENFQGFVVGETLEKEM